MKKFITIIIYFLISVLFFTSCDVEHYRTQKECEEIQKLMLRDKKSYKFESFEYCSGIIDSDRGYDSNVSEFCDEMLERKYMRNLDKLAYKGFKDSIHERLDTTNKGITLYETYRLLFYAKNGLGLSTIGESYWIYSWRHERGENGVMHNTPKKLVGILHCDEKLKYIYYDKYKPKYKQIVDFSNWETFGMDEFFINAKVSCDWYGEQISYIKK